jgi:hypothetical protein
MTWQDVITDHWRKLARVKQWAGVMALQAIEDHHAEQMKNIQAENEMNRTMLTGQKSTAADDDVRQTILGDYHITNQPSQPSQIGKMLIGLGLAATGAGAGYGGVMIADAIKNRPVESTTVIEQPADTDTDTSVILSLPELPE